MNDPNETTTDDDTSQDGFKIDSPTLADWALGKIRDADELIDNAAALRDANKAAARETYEKLLARADQWFESKTRDATATRTNMLAYLRRWFEPRYTDEHKSDSLPNGLYGFRKNLPILDVQDTEAAVAWARDELPEAICTTEVIDKKIVRAHIESTGEIPDGVNYTPVDPTFYATPAK